MRASPQERDAMVDMMRGVSWGYEGDDDLDVSCVVRSSNCDCGEEARDEDASVGEEGGHDDVSLSSSGPDDAASTAALSTILTISASLKR